MHCRPLVRLDILFLTDSFAQRDIDDLIVLHTDHDTALLFQQRLHCRHAHTRSDDSVVSRRATATLQVTEDSHAGVVLGVILLQHFGYSLCAALDSMLLYKHYTGVLALAATLTDSFLQLLMNGGTFGDNSRLCARGDSRTQRQEACVTTHNLYQEHTLMTRSRVAQFVHAIHNRVQTRVITDG